MRATKTMTVDERLRNIGWTEVDGCWVWNGAKSATGYGLIRLHGKSTNVHRLAYETWVKPVAEGMLVLHSCHRRACINPDHLREGTNAENTADMMAAGRHANGERPRGEGHPNAKLTHEQVDAIRQAYADGKSTQYELAAEYGVSQKTVGNIVHGRTYIFHREM